MEIIDQMQSLKDESKQELLTREYFEERCDAFEKMLAERFNVIDEKFKAKGFDSTIDGDFKRIDDHLARMHLKLNSAIGFAIALLLAHSNFWVFVSRICLRLAELFPPPLSETITRLST